MERYKKKCYHKRYRKRCVKITDMIAIPAPDPVNANISAISRLLVKYCSTIRSAIPRDTPPPNPKANAQLRTSVTVLFANDAATQPKTTSALPSTVT